ncbi:MAG: 4-alpha-glucanotransferase [bacterium]
MASEAGHPLASLAQAFGLEGSYVDYEGQGRSAGDEVLFAALRALGAPLHSEAEVPTALRERNLRAWRRVLEPVSVAWADETAAFELRLPEAATTGTIPGELGLESGEVVSFRLNLAELPDLEIRRVEGRAFARKRGELRQALPLGCHCLRLEFPDRVWESRLIVAPRRAYYPPHWRGKRQWGLFLPLYALQTETTWGAGDFGALEKLLYWTQAQGGHAVATLPFHASFLDWPCDPSPYAPASRLFWNEFFLEIPKIAELESCPEARELMQSGEFEAALDAARRSPTVDYRDQMARKRRVLELLARHFFSRDSERRGEFQAFLASRPELEDYAGFRATMEELQTPWREWPEPLRSGRVGPGDCDPARRDYHRYVQWLAQGQVEALKRSAQARDVALYLDLPLGVHSQGYDIWKNQKLFAAGVAVGAPPDGFFTGGQNWGFPPLLPEASREQGHAYLQAVFRHQLEAAGLLRIDHVMGLHRLYWIPEGFSAKEGCYLRYPAEELYALLCLESHRHECALVGEDLGTVPEELRPAMADHGLLGCHVAQFAFRPAPRAPLGEAASDRVASLNTHDTPTFAGFWEGQDLDARHDLGLIDAAQLEALRKERRELRHGMVEALVGATAGGSEAETDSRLLGACLDHLASLAAAWVLVNLEDLWGEAQPQNVPGTGEERPNWRRKAVYSFEEFRGSERVLQLLRQVARHRPG